MKRSQLFKDLVISAYKWTKDYADEDYRVNERDLRTTNLMMEAIFHSLPLDQKLAVEKYIAERLEEK